jgi:alkylated DNA repair dioxygenase AlkB
VRISSRDTGPKFPEGFRYWPDLIGPEREAALLARVRSLPFREFEFHGYTGRRRTVSFGWHYDFLGHQLLKVADIPGFLQPLKETAAAFAGLEPGEFEHALVTEYNPEAGIGWHRDKAVFGKVLGVSLLTPCLFRMRRGIGERRWERVSLMVEPRSAHLLTRP